MKDLTDPRWIKFKGILFLIVGVLAAALLILEMPTTKAVVLLGIVIWCFCRAYYFAFYVLEMYVDSNFRFSGLGSAIRYLVIRRPTAKRNDVRPTGEIDDFPELF